MTVEHNGCRKMEGNELCVVAQSLPTRLLTTRLRTGVAAGLTAFVFVLDIRNILRLGHARGWLLPLDFVLHGWSLVVVNVVFYGYLCWLGLWFIRGTEGLERFFIVGWFAGILLWPLKMLRPQWAVTMRQISAFGLAVALLAAVALLLVPPDVPDRNGPN